MLIAFSPWKSCLLQLPLCVPSVRRRCRLFPLNTEILIKSPFRITRLLLENPVVNTRQFIKKVIRNWRNSIVKEDDETFVRLQCDIQVLFWQDSCLWILFGNRGLAVITGFRISVTKFILIRSSWRISRLDSDFENWWNTLKKRPSRERNNFRQRLLNRVLLNILLIFLKVLKLFCYSFVTISECI